MLNGLDVSSGSKELSRALQDWIIPIAYCEEDGSALIELLHRMSDGELPVAPIHSKLEAIKATSLPEVDIIYGSLANQDSSTNGHGEGVDEERAKIFKQIQKLICEIRPRFVYLENVPATNIQSVEKTHEEMFTMGYECRWGMDPDYARKEKWFMLSYEVQTLMLELERVSDDVQPTFENYVRLNDLPRPENRNTRIDNMVVPDQSRQVFAILMGME